MSTWELIERDLDALTEPLQRQVYDFAHFLRRRAEGERFNGLLLSESALSKDWMSRESGESAASPSRR
jgi:hypothetical protein